MRIYKFIQIILPSLLFLVVITPIFNHVFLDTNPIVSKHFPSELDSDSSSINLLFRYDNLSEKNSIIQTINRFNPSFFHFYRNFPIGFVRFQ